MKKFKLFASIASMCMALAVLCFGVYSAQNVTYTIGGSISYEVTDVFVEISARVYSVADQKTTEEMTSEISELSLKSFDQIEAAGSGYTKTQTLTKFTTSGDTQEDYSFDAKDETNSNNGVDVNFNNAYTYYVVVNIKNLSPSKPVSAYINGEVTLGENSNTNIATYVSQHNIAQEETRNIVLGFSLKDRKASVPSDTTFSCPIKVDYNGMPQDIPDGLSFEFNNDGTAYPADYTGTQETITIPSRISKDSNGNAIKGTDYVVNLCNGNYYYSNIGKAKNIILAEGITEINGDAFASCTTLESVVIPNGVKEIDYEAFNECTNLKTVILPNTLEEISDDAFNNCTNLKDLKLPNSLEWIGENTFYNCGLTTLIIPDRVSRIEPTAFKNCTSLTKVIIKSKKIDYLANDVFDGCNDSIFTGDDNALYLSDGTNPYHILYKAKSTNITSYSINENTKIIGSAFDGCTGLTSITIPSSVTSIGGSAFSDCTGLTSVTIPSSVTSIGSDVFSGCTGLESISIPSSVTSIGKYAFFGCTGLTSITIPSSVTSIGSDAFSGCTGLESVVVEEGNPRYTSENGSNCIIDKTTNTLILGIKTTTIPNCVTSIGSSAFNGCTGLTSIIIPSSVTSIGSDAFSGCTKLASITIPSGVTSIGSPAFFNCKSLITINYTGSQEEWNKITKGGNWDYNCPTDMKIVCNYNAN